MPEKRMLDAFLEGIFERADADQQTSMNVARRRYVDAKTAEELRSARTAELTPTGALSLNISTLEWTEWYIVPDDDPRLNTVEQV